MAFHCELTGLDIHVINTWTYANSAARDAATGFTADDVYKVAIQTDNNSVWMLVDHSPITWKKIATEDDITSLVTDFLSLTDTPSAYSGKSLQLVRVNAGETALEFAPSGTGGVAALDTEYATNEGVSSTTSTTYQQKLRLTTSNLAAGTYMIQYNWEFNGDNNHGWSRAQLNDTTDLAEDRYDSSQIEYIIISGFSIQSLSGVNTIDIDFRANSGGDTMLIRRARIALWRIS